MGGIYLLIVCKLPILSLSTMFWEHFDYFLALA
jgi:hypothetical protein